MMKSTSFIYQFAKPTDVEQIVTLFKLCLGTEGGAPTLAFWNWKHNENPAGVSPVILAWDQDKLIGIRAFMCFKFIKNNESYVGYRPVDTATHPDYQGKGIFKNLTLTLLEELKKKEENAFVFNTPNSKSKPGYLKMGWIEWGKPFLQLMPTFSIFGNSFKKDQERLLNYDFSTISKPESNHLAVYKDAEYLAWRYQKISLQQYGMKIMDVNNTQYTIIYRQKKIKFLNEYRICDVLKNKTICTEISTIILFKLFFSFGFGVFSFITKKTFWFTIKLNNKAPMITYRKIKEEDAMLLFNKADLSTGELELF
jgi:GNAT superfamily N-acetyltransferase